jgi:hypothetical protein
LPLLEEGRKKERKKSLLKAQYIYKYQVEAKAKAGRSVVS